MLFKEARIRSKKNLPKVGPEVDQRREERCQGGEKAKR